MNVVGSLFESTFVFCLYPRFIGWL